MPEPRYGPTGAGVVLLELGAGIGALILHVPAELNGSEIDISRSGEPGRATHARTGTGAAGRRRGELRGALSRARGRDLLGMA